MRISVCVIVLYLATIIVCAWFYSPSFVAAAVLVVAVLFFKTDSLCIAQAGPKLTMSYRPASNTWQFSCLRLSSAEIAATSRLWFAFSQARTPWLFHIAINFSLAWFLIAARYPATQLPNHPAADGYTLTGLLLPALLRVHLLNTDYEYRAESWAARKYAGRTSRKPAGETSGSRAKGAGAKNFTCCAGNWDWDSRTQAQ